MKIYVKGSRGAGLIGLWWYNESDNSVWGLTKPLDSGVIDGSYTQYSYKDNHLTKWSQVVKDNVTDKDMQASIIAKGYKSLERGRVIYNNVTQCYEITCSKGIVDDIDFRAAIIDYFNLSGNRYEFVALNHYSKLELTGNPALDDFIMNTQM